MGHTHRCQLAFKKKNQVRSPSLESRVPETGSDPPIGSGRDSGRDSNPFRVIPLLGISSPCRGNIFFFRSQEAFERRLILEADFEESRVVVLMLLDITCIRMLDFNMCLYKNVINS